MLLNLHIKCWNSAFNAQCSRVIIVVVQVGAPLWQQWRRSRKRRDRMKLNYHQNWRFPQFHPQLNAHVYFCRFKKKIHLVYDQTQGSGAIFSITLQISLLPTFFRVAYNSISFFNFLLYSPFLLWLVVYTTLCIWWIKAHFEAELVIIKLLLLVCLSLLSLK
jgi:hypothetical protein